MKPPATPDARRPADGQAAHRDRFVVAEPPAEKPDGVVVRQGEYVLVVDDEPAVRQLMAAQLDHLGYAQRTAKSVDEALAVLRRHAGAVLVLSDVQMPGGGGMELLEELRRTDQSVQVVMVSGHQDIDTVRDCLRRGAYDYLVKPYDLADLSLTLERAVEHGRLQRQNEEYRRSLERMVLERTTAVRETRDIALLTLAKLAESRDTITGNHLERMAAYSRRLAEELRRGAYAASVDDSFIEHLYKSSPLHDIGKVGIPDRILLKPGRLDEQEFEIMKQHAAIGGETLDALAASHPGARFLHMARDIAWTHHERFDGTGYPRGLAGSEIPLCGRITAVADVYDALTSRRVYKEAYSHETAVSIICDGRGSHFDPDIVDALLRREDDFKRLKEALADPREVVEAGC